jgi:hypothetical protein
LIQVNMSPASPVILPLMVIARDIMTTAVVSARAGTPIREVAALC